MKSIKCSHLPVLLYPYFPYTVHFFAANTLLRFGGDGTWWRRTSSNKCTWQTKKDMCSVQYCFYFTKLENLDTCTGFPSAVSKLHHNRNAVRWKKKKQKTTKKLNRSNAYHAPISPVKCLWSSRLRSSSRITLSSNAAAASTVAFGSKSSSYGIKAVPLPSKISFCSTVLNQICLSKKWTKNTEQTTPQ